MLVTTWLMLFNLLFDNIACAEIPAQPATLLYQGKASIRIVTAEGKIIYIDPYAGAGYGLPADLILVTHAHFDHSSIETVQSQNDNCVIITQEEALADGVHQTCECHHYCACSFAE